MVGTKFWTYLARTYLKLGFSQNFFGSRPFSHSNCTSFEAKFC